MRVQASRPEALQPALPSPLGWAKGIAGLRP